MSYQQMHLKMDSNRDTLARNFKAHERNIMRSMSTVVRKYGKLIFNETYRRTPERTGTMARLLKLDFSMKGATVTLNFTVGWYAEDFFAEGVRFYPPYLETGTRFMVAQPSLGPAFAIYRPLMRREISEALRRR